MTFRIWKSSESLSGGLRRGALLRKAVCIDNWQARTAVSWLKTNCFHRHVQGGWVYWFCHLPQMSFKWRNKEKSVSCFPGTPFWFQGEWSQKGWFLTWLGWFNPFPDDWHFLLGRAQGLELPEYFHACWRWTGNPTGTSVSTFPKLNSSPSFPTTAPPVFLTSAHGTAIRPVPQARNAAALLSSSLSLPTPYLSRPPQRVGSN